MSYPLRFFHDNGKEDAYTILGIPFQTHLYGVDSPGVVYLLGSDNFGRDILSRLVYGAQISLSIGLVGILISMSLGMLVGGIAGFYRLTGDSLNLVAQRVGVTSHTTGLRNLDMGIAGDLDRE